MLPPVMWNRSRSIRSLSAVLCTLTLVSCAQTVRSPDQARVGSARAATNQLKARTSADSVITHAHAVLAISEFFLEWQKLWKQSATLRAAMPGGSGDRDLRLPYLHCHPDAEQGVRATSGVAATKATENFARKYSQFSLVQSEHSWFSVCPSWLLSAVVPEVEDERINRDGALVSPLRPVAQAARSRLLDSLDSAALLYPGSGFITAQRVRFRVDQGDFEGAIAVVRECKAERWWCLALSAFVLERQNSWVEAEAQFSAMQAAMQTALPADTLCEWNDVRDLLAPSEHAAYEKLRCADRRAVQEQFWWLADPLLRVAGNERWVAHQARRVDGALRSALDGDERYVWLARRGGDAIARVIVRYDWPSYTWWDNKQSDDGHSSYLRTKHSAAVPPYTTFEYTFDRVHLVPTWSAVNAPFSARDVDWELFQETPDGSPDPGWWASELFHTTRRLVQLPPGQVVLLRRQSEIVMARAHRMRQPLMLLPVDGAKARFDALLLSSKSASEVDTLAHTIAESGATAVLRGTIKGTPTLLAVEAMGLGASILDARTRFGVQPPTTLAAMNRDETAISDPALFDADAVSDAQLSPKESLLEHLLGSLNIEPNKRRVGVYWETYGIDSKDTVTIAVSVLGDKEVGGLRRLAMALNVASDPNKSVVVRWTEPNPQHSTLTLPGRVPVQLRSLVLNLARLSPGPYILRIGIERRGVLIASSERRVVLEP